MDQFADRLARLAELSPDELQALEDELTAAFDAADSSGDVDLMQALADALDTVRAAKTATPPAEAPAAAPPGAAPVAAAADVLEHEVVDELIAPVETPVATDTPTEPEVPAEPVPEPGEPLPADPDDVPDPEQAEDDLLKALVKLSEAELKALAALPEADRQALALMVAGDQPITPPTEGEPVAPDQQQEEIVAAEVVTQEDVPGANKPLAAAAFPYMIRAGGDIPGVTSGMALKDHEDVIDVMTKKINALRGVSGNNEPVIVASLIRDPETIDEGKLLRKADPEGNSAKIRTFLKENESRESMTAAGWCAPRTPLYDIPGIGSTDTPVADSLPSFGVDRGGIVWTEPPSLGALRSGNSPFTAGFRFSRWDPNLDPNNPGRSIYDVWHPIDYSTTPPTQTPVPTVPADTKPCWDVPCGVERAADLIALPLCLCFDLLSSRTNPEFVKATTDLVEVAQAAFKEQWLMAQMWNAPGVVNNDGGSTYGQPDVNMGIARDWLVTLRLVCSQFRWRNRLSATQQMRVYAPNWLRDAIASDFLIQMPGDDSMSVGYTEIDGYLNDANVDAIWYIDDVPAGPGQNPVNDGSNFDSYNGYPAQAEWLVTSPGVYTRLDGGQVDLGVVRTKEDVQKNKFCEFAETFENVAYMGPTDPDNAWAVRGTTPVLIKGNTAGTIDTGAGHVSE